MMGALFWTMIALTASAGGRIGWTVLALKTNACGRVVLNDISIKSKRCHMQQDAFPPKARAFPEAHANLHLLKNAVHATQG
jgi:hypothetical protein